MSTLPSLHAILLPDGLLNPTSWDFINFLYGDSLLSHNFASSTQWVIKNSVNLCTPDKSHKFERSDLGPSSNIAYNSKSDFLPSVDC